MSRYRRTSGDVIRWPDSPDARTALEEWFAASPDTAYLSGDFLDFGGADLSRLDLAGAYLANSRLAGVRFAEANLADANLANAEMQGADFSSADLAKATLVGCSAGQALFPSARLFSAQLDHAVLAGADLGRAILNSATLYQTDLRDADLELASLRWCTLGSTSMPTVLTGARMFGCQLDGAKGAVVGPVLVDEGTSRSLGGVALEAWFAGQGAADVRVVD
ncbi:pentapeptide repeat-containing protein [Micromonospora sp. WMMD961]|uniref:pentapeptide repeat-containing protein n=1 Tax=Micromonospora sp. WMMD961 TaxID=3016100 RepID=UPI0024160DD5|nr:pentapeptide repeat-containing protein [Micromonospora sp. WMMD961]MDG4778083.1 pentapeptide repeat-containing protein [Micromonospora sp. WMMD961]